MIAERINIASTKTHALVSAAASETNPVRRKALEDCGLAIALAMGSLGDMRAASDEGWKIAAREMEFAWRQMEAAVRAVTGEPAVTLVAPPKTPAIPPLAN